MKYVFYIVQTAMILGKIFEIEPVCNYSWWVIFTPVIIAIVISLLITIIVLKKRSLFNYDN